jgi:hypothetical protein
LLLAKKLYVEKVSADIFGGFQIAFSEQHFLTGFTSLSRKSEYSEFWRLLNNRDDSLNHIVVGTFGIMY